MQDAGYLTLQKDVISRMRTTEGQRAAQPAAVFHARAANGELNNSAAGGDAWSALAARNQQPGHPAGSDCVSDEESHEQDPACLEPAEPLSAQSAEQAKEQLHPGGETTSRMGLRRNYVYSVLHSAAYNVPVLFFRGCTPGADTHRSTFLLATVMLSECTSHVLLSRLSPAGFISQYVPLDCVNG